MLELYLDDYYKGKIDIVKLEELIGRNKNYINTYLKQNKLLTYRGWLQKLNFQNYQLRKNLIHKYNSIVYRCNGRLNSRYGNYKGMEYLSVIDWVNFCNSNKKSIERLWEIYIKNNKILKYALSVDRIDVSKGYLVENIEIVPHGYNSWKDEVRPIQVIYNNDIYYFMSCKEGCRYFKIRDRVLSECLNNVKYCNKNFLVSLSSIETVLESKNCSSKREYYDKFIK